MIRFYSSVRIPPKVVYSLNHTEFLLQVMERHRRELRQVSTPSRIVITTGTHAQITPVGVAAGTGVGVGTSVGAGEANGSVKAETGLTVEQYMKEFCQTQLEGETEEEAVAAAPGTTQVVYKVEAADGGAVVDGGNSVFVDENGCVVVPGSDQVCFTIFKITFNINK